jgi:L-alanine-DL-glutamate epimerase-like enolase superfamily enzyme
MKLQRLSLHPVTIARETKATNQHIIVRVEAEGDRVGWGEMSDLSHLPMHQFDLPALERALNDLIVGQDAHDLLRLEDAFIRAFPEEGYKYSRSGSVRQGVELALLDLVGREQGVPVYQLFGGKLRDRIRVCYPIFAMRSVEQVPANLERVQARHEQGFDLIRLYAGANLEADELFLRQFVERFTGQVAIKSFDFSNALDWRRAWQATERLAQIVEPTLVESVVPHHDLDGLVEYRRRSRWPVSEHVFHIYHGWQLLSRGCVDILNISPYLLGGLRASLRLATLAEAARCGVLIGTTQELSLGTAAIAHLGAAMRVLDYPSDSTGPELYTQDVVKQRVTYVKGHLLVPDGPGLGVEVDEALLASLTGEMKWTFGSNLSAVLDRLPPGKAAEGGNGNKADA